MIRPTTILAAAPVKGGSGATPVLPVICLVLFLVAFALVWLENLKVLTLPGNPDWPAAWLLFATGITTLVSLGRQLPAQNVLMAACIIAAIAGTAQALGAITGIPFGPYLYLDAAGPKFFKILPWSIPVIWIIVILNARGVARLILRPWRKSRLYGFRLIGVTAVLSLTFDFGLEPFATLVNTYWLWRPTKLALSWFGAPPSNFLGWLVTALLVLAFVTPVMINKSHQKFPSDYQPLIVWIFMNLLFATGAATHHLWLASGFVAVATLFTAVLAVRGARW